MLDFLKRLTEPAEASIHARAHTRAWRRHARACQFESLESRQLLSLTVDLRLSGGSQSAEITAVGQKIKMDVWAVVRGKDAKGANDGVATVTGSFLSSITTGTGASSGNLSATPLAPFNALGSQSGRVQDLSSPADGSLDVGSNDNSNGGAFFAARAGKYVVAGTVKGACNSFRIASLTYTVTALHDGVTRIAFRPRTSAIPAIWLEDNAEPVTPSFLAGAAVTLRYVRTPSITFNAATGALGVQGTSAADTIRLGISSGNLVINVNTMTRSFAKTAVKRISILGMAGNDRITLGKGVIGATIDAGAGNDTIYCRNSARDTVDGGDGINSAQMDTFDKRTRMQKVL